MYRSFLSKIGKQGCLEVVRSRQPLKCLKPGQRAGTRCFLFIHVVHSARGCIVQMNSIAAIASCSIKTLSQLSSTQI